MKANEMKMEQVLKHFDSSMNKKQVAKILSEDLGFKNVSIGLVSDYKYPTVILEFVYNNKVHYIEIFKSRTNKKIQWITGWYYLKLSIEDILKRLRRQTNKAFKDNRFEGGYLSSYFSPEVLFRSNGTHKILAFKENKIKDVTRKIEQLENQIKQLKKQEDNMRYLNKF